MQIKYQLSVLAISALIYVSPANSEGLSDYRADIRATHHGAIDIKAKGNMAFNLEDDGKWTLEVAITDGPIKSLEKSTGETVNNEYRPLSYRRETKVLFVKEKINWQFDWSAETVTGKVKKKNYRYNLGSIIHDPLSFQLPLRKAMSEGQTDFKYTFLRYSNPGGLEFKVIGEELLSLDNGRVHTLILKQIKPTRANQKKLIWVSPEHDYVPIRFATFKKNKIKDDVIVTKLWLNNERVAFKP